VAVTINFIIAGGGEYNVVGGAINDTGGGGGDTSSPGAILTSPTFSVDGTYIIAIGPARALSVILDTSVVGAVVVYDNTSDSGPTLLASTVTAVGSNIVIPINADANTAITIVVTGNNVGRVTYKEIE
jgi:hypothetical protein